MADALKHHFNADVVRGIATDIGRCSPDFDTRAFVRDATKGLDALELTPRGTHVAAAMRKHLPPDYASALAILVASMGPPLGESGLTGMAVFRYLPYAAFIRDYGLDHVEASLDAQHALTRRFTAEWSLRPFLERHEAVTLARLRTWASDPNVHVRRVVSEGTRPRLPWAPVLRRYIADPSPVLELLERLKDDPELYVRRSVANNLNDIAKDHPEVVVTVARRWMVGASEDRRWIVQHALRSLVKRGHRGALDVLGAGRRPSVSVSAAAITPQRVPVGGICRFTFEVASKARRPQDLLIDYVVHFVKADGSRRPKVFKARRVLAAPGSVTRVSGSIRFVPMTTRTPYPGQHTLEARINGHDFPLGAFEVVRARGSRRRPSARGRAARQGS